MHSPLPSRASVRRKVLWIGLFVGLALIVGVFVFIHRRQGSTPAEPVAVASSEIARKNYPAPMAKELSRRVSAVAAEPSNPAAVRSLARFYHANRLYDEAKATYRKLQELPGGLTAQDHYYLADIAQQNNALDEAIKELRTVSREVPNYLPARLILAQALSKSGQVEPAKAEFAACLAIEPGEPEATVGLAKLKLQERDEDGAVRDLEELMAAHPECTEGAALLGPLLRRRGDTDRAAAFAQVAQRKPMPPPPDPWSASLLVNDCYDPQRLSLAIEEDLRIGRASEVSALLDRFAQLDAKAPNLYIFQGLLRAQAKDYAGAVESYQQALSLGGDPEKICPPLVPCLLAIGKEAEAGAMLAQYHNQRPESLPIAKAYAAMVLRKEDYKTAEPLLNFILVKEPFLKTENMALAKIYWESGRRDRATECLKRVAASDPEDVPSRALLGEYYLGQNDAGTAIVFLEQAIAHAAPKSAERESLVDLYFSALMQQGQNEAKAGRLEEAKALVDRALQSAPERAEAYATKAEICAELHDYDGAVAVLRRLSRLQPKNPTVFLTLGDMYSQKGDTAQAREQWEQARRLVAADDTALQQAIGQRLGPTESATSP